jgi:peptidase E
MTKYILNSGNSKKYPKKELVFLNEILAGFEGEVKILYCFFAQPRERWESRFEAYSERFASLTGKADSLVFELAFPATFQKQVESNDIILIQGGDDYLLRFWLGQFDLEKIFEGKVVATSSAGSDLLVSSFWTCDWRDCLGGLGILPIKFIPHFDSDYGSDDPRGKIDWDDARKELEEYGDKLLPIHALKEGEFIVIEK